MQHILLGLASFIQQYVSMQQLLMVFFGAWNKIQTLSWPVMPCITWPLCTNVILCQFHGPLCFSHPSCLFIYLFIYFFAYLFLNTSSFLPQDLRTCGSLFLEYSLPCSLASSFKLQLMIQRYFPSSLFFFLINLFIYFWPRWVFVAERGLSLVATLCCGAWASHCGGFSCCGARALGAQASVVAARGLSSCGSQALECRLSSCGARAQLLQWHVGSSQTRDRTRVPCIGRWILNPCATREVPFPHHFILLILSCYSLLLASVASLYNTYYNYNDVSACLIIFCLRNQTSWEQETHLLCSPVYTQYLTQ